MYSRKRQFSFELLLMSEIVLIILTDKKLYCHYVNARTFVMVSFSSSKQKSIKLTTTKDENKLKKIAEKEK